MYYIHHRHTVRQLDIYRYIFALQYFYFSLDNFSRLILQILKIHKFSLFLSLSIFFVELSKSAIYACTYFSEFVIVVLYCQRIFKEGRKVNHNNVSSEPHSPNFFVRATSESSSFDYFVFKSFQFLQKIKLFFKNLASLGHKILME